MNKKKLFALLLAALMLLMLVACGGGGGSSSQQESSAGEAQQEDSTVGDDNDDDDSSEDADGTGGALQAADLEDIIPDQTLNLVVYSQLANYSGEQIGWSAELLQERFNVKFTIVNDADGTFATRMASGDLGDIVIFGNDGMEYESAVQAGMLYDWEEDELVEEYGPYIYEHMQPALEKNRNVSGTGTLYGFGFNVASSLDDHGAFFYYPDVRWDLYEKIGFPEVKTLEDYVDVLEQMVEVEPTSDTGKKTYGVSLMADWDGNMAMFVKATAALYGYDEFHFGLYDVATQEFEDCLMEDGMYIRCLKFYNTLYQKGLLDPDSMTQTYDDMIEDYNTGAAFFNIFNWMGSGVYNTPEHLAEGKAMMPLAANDLNNIVYGLAPFGGNRVWTIGAKTDYPELCMAIINWLSTPEGTMSYFLGPQGVVWDYDENNNPYLTELGFNCKMDEETQITYGNYTGTWKDGQFRHNNETWAEDSENPMTNGETYNWKFWDSTQSLLEKSDIEKAWSEKVNANNPDEYLENNNHMSISLATEYSEGTRDAELNTTWEQVKDCIVTGSWSAIYAKDDEEFDKVVVEMREKAISYGYEECIEWCENEASIRREKENDVKNAM